MSYVCITEADRARSAHVGKEDRDINAKKFVEKN